jgi:hypothetical protein
MPTSVDVISASYPRPFPSLHPSGGTVGLKKNGRTVEVRDYGNEGYGFRKRENRIDAMRRVVDWFERHMKPTDAPR